jgi:predicted N-formylglutamate amidohydrolase
MESAVDYQRALPDEKARADQTWLPFHEAISQETGVSASKGNRVR